MRGAHRAEIKQALAEQQTQAQNEIQRLRAELAAKMHAEQTAFGHLMSELQARNEILETELNCARERIRDLETELQRTNEQQEQTLKQSAEMEKRIERDAEIMLQLDRRHRRMEDQLALAVRTVFAPVCFWETLFSVSFSHSRPAYSRLINSFFLLSVSRRDSRDKLRSALKYRSMCKRNSES